MSPTIQDEASSLGKFINSRNSAPTKLAKDVLHRNAVEYAKGVQHKIILVDGQRLAQLMIEYGVSVSTFRTITLKRVDSDYFEE